MSFSRFIKENREEIDRIILAACPNAQLNDYGRKLWVLNDEGLYNWARSCGVRI